MEVLIEKILIYGGTGLILVLAVLLYILKIRRQSRIVERKIKTAKEDGLYEPVSLHPVVDPNSCIQTGACIRACPEHDILGIRNGVATVINASQCIGHGACFHACPTEAISLHIGTEKRGVDLPHVDENFETNVPGIFIAGEIGGMGLIKNAVEQGKQAVSNLVKGLESNTKANYDLIIVGAGPAGISATLQAKKLGLNTLTIEQDSLGGTVYTFPRRKIVMTSAMDLPLHGKVRLNETSKSELLGLWTSVLGKNELNIKENSKAEKISSKNGHLELELNNGDKLTAQRILLTIGRRGTPRKLGIPGEGLPKVAYRLLEPEQIHKQKVLIVGGGDSAIESVLMLMEENEVCLSYRKDAFARLKPGNRARIEEAMSKDQFMASLNTNLVAIGDTEIVLKSIETGEELTLENDLVYIFAGGELPTQFLANAGITITRKFGESVLTHKKKN